MANNGDRRGYRGNQQRCRGCRCNNRFQGQGQGSIGGSRTTKTPELKFAPQGNTRTPMVTYNSVKEVLISHIQETFKNGQDIVKSLKQMQIVDLSPNEPTLSIAPTGANQEIEQPRNNIKYQEELGRFMEDKDLFKEGLNKACILIFTTYCTKAMQPRIKEHPGFVLFIKDDRIVLLKMIKTLMHDTVRVMPLISIIKAMASLIKAKQADDKYLLNYIKCLKQL